MREYSFERLDVWQLSMKLAESIYSITGKFPAEERFGITGQLRRAAVSISNNLAEGSSRTTGTEQARFTEISYGSLMEVLNLLLLAQKLNYLDIQILVELRNTIDEIGNKLTHLKKRQRDR